MSNLPSNRPKPMFDQSGATEAALVPRDRQRPVWDDHAIQKLWIATKRRSWRTLAVVAGGANAPTLELANLLSKIAWWYDGHPSHVLDYRDLSLRLLHPQLQQLEQVVAEGDRAMVALRSIPENPTVSSVASAADVVVMCIELGKTPITTAAATVKEIGKERFLGAIVLDPGRNGAGAKK